MIAFNSRHQEPDTEWVRISQNSWPLIHQSILDNAILPTRFSMSQAFMRRNGVTEDGSTKLCRPDAVCCSLAGRRKKPVPATGLAREMQFAYLVAEAAFFSEAGIGRLRGRAMEIHPFQNRRPARVAWRWPSFTMRGVAAVALLERRRQFLKKDAHDVFAFAPRLAFDLLRGSVRPDDAGALPQGGGRNCAGLPRVTICSANERPLSPWPAWWSRGLCLMRLQTRVGQH